jgi:protein-glutamine gamma-glutamyltransferase
MLGAAPVAQRPVERFFEFSLLGLLLSGYCAVAGSGFLDLPTVVLAGLSLAIRVLMLTGVLRFALSERIVTAVTIGYIGFYAVDSMYVSRDFLTATVHLIFFLAIMKVLTAHSNRDYFFLKVLAFLQLLAASVLSTSLSFFVFLGLFLAFTVATFTSSEIRRASQKREVVIHPGLRRFPARLAALCSVVTAGILVVSAGLFLILPRTARAAFLRFSTGRYAVTGFSNQVTLGQLGQLRQESTPVLHALLPEGKRGADYKWRGIALGRFDGRRWTNPFPSEEVKEVFGNAVQLRETRRLGPDQYDVFLHSSGSDMLFFAGRPDMLSLPRPRVVLTALDAYRVLDGADDLHYAVRGRLGPLPGNAVAEDIDAAPLPAELRAAFLQLPTVDDRIPLLARGITSAAATDAERARLVEQYLRTRYTYTTKLLDAPVDDALADFLFVRRKGHCEYFASAMAIMLRTIQIPSRVVTGFQSGVFNPITGMQVIRLSDAHSWVEAWIPQRGWITFDPTPADPTPTGTLSARLSLYMDAAETFWQDWVVNYDLEHQLNLASSVNRSSRSWSLSNWWPSVFFNRVGASVASLARRHGPWLVAFIAALAALLISAPRLRKQYHTRRQLAKVKRGVVSASDATLLYLRMLSCLHRRGVEKPPWLTPAEFAGMMATSPAAPIIDGITREYELLRFGSRTESGPRMLALIEQLEAARDLSFRVTP